jgi:flavin reductase (DIM6/NTAB) family NADH-FMN oxidoreductase RutF
MSTENKQRYLDMMSAFPTGVAVITSLDADGEPRGMTCSSIASATLVPPTLLVCLKIGSATLEAVQCAGGFAVNLLHSAGQRAAEVFSGPAADRFAQVHWLPSPAGYPWLDEDAFAGAECQVSTIVPVGTHAIVLGEVRDISPIAGTPLLSGTPLLYGMRRFETWPSMAG